MVRLSRRLVIGGMAAMGAAFAGGCTTRMGAPARPGGWPRRSPADAGLQVAALERAAETMGQAGERQGLVVVRDGALVFERYWANDYHRAEPDWRNVSFSSGKSWGATMVGRAINLGYLALDDLASQYVAPSMTGLHPATRIHHLLTMTSGGSLVVKPSSHPPRKLIDRTPPGPPDEYVLTVGKSKEPRAPEGYGIDLEPGSMFFYDGAAADHLAEIVAAATGTRSFDFMRQEVLKPLGCRNTGYQPEGVDSNGDIRIGGSMLISCRDMARLGQLYLQKGRWGSARLLDASFVDAATSPSPDNPDYGFLWWLNTTGEIPAAPRSMFYAAGALGQYCFVVPQSRLVVATMGFGRPALTPQRAWEILAPALLAT